VKLSNSEDDNYYNPNCIFSNSKILPTNADYPYTDNSKDTVLSPIYSFIFDYNKVKSEIIATNKVITKYKSNLFVGKGDYAELSKKFNEDLEKAGVQKIVDEANKQIAIWQKTNK
jgi:putative aldouronate transport system substrate-binding protein